MHMDTHRGFTLKLHEKSYDALEAINLGEPTDIDPYIIKQYFGENLNNLRKSLRQLADFKVDPTLSKNTMVYFQAEFNAAPPDVEQQINALVGDDPYVCYQDHFETLVQITAILNHHDVQNIYRYHHPEKPSEDLSVMVDIMVEAYIKMQNQLRKENIIEKYVRLTIERDDPGMTTPIELAVLNQPGRTFIESIVYDLIDKRIDRMPDKIAVYAIGESRLYLWTISNRYRKAMRK